MGRIEYEFVFFRVLCDLNLYFLDVLEPWNELDLLHFSCSIARSLTTRTQLISHNCLKLSFFQLEKRIKSLEIYII